MVSTVSPAVSTAFTARTTLVVSVGSIGFLRLRGSVVRSMMFHQGCDGTSASPCWRTYLRRFSSMCSSPVAAARHSRFRPYNRSNRSQNTCSSHFE
jgi:hypothetical protein